MKERLEWGYGLQIMKKLTEFFKNGLKNITCGRSGLQFTWLLSGLVEGYEWERERSFSQAQATSPLPGTNMCHSNFPHLL